MRLTACHLADVISCKFDFTYPYIRDADGFYNRLAYRSGVTNSITAPQGGSLIPGLSVAFSSGAAHSLEHGAVIKDITAVHVSIAARGQPSVSTQIGLLRQILLSQDESRVTSWFKKVAQVRSAIRWIQHFSHSLHL